MQQKKILTEIIIMNNQKNHFSDDIEMFGYAF